LLSKKIAQVMMSKSSDEDDNQNLNKLLRDRARLLSSAENKLVALNELLSQQAPSPLTLFYCGDGRVEDPCSGDEERQIEVVSKLLHDRGWKSSRFTSYEARVIREQLLDHFRLKIIDSLVAIRCLDEGIDVPGCKRAFLLASSRNPRQQIQRRGRILRKSAGKEFAEIYDFLVMLPPSSFEESSYERSLLVKEMERVAEFAVLARNHGKVVKSLLPILMGYGLSHLLVAEPEEKSASAVEGSERDTMHLAAEKALLQLGTPTHNKELARYMEAEGYFHFTADNPASALDTCLARRSIEEGRIDHTGECIFYKHEPATYGLLVWKSKN
jgi:superfamily II DNA or RNA helicase